MPIFWLYWNDRHNLVSARSLADVWKRHLWDCAQLVPLVRRTPVAWLILARGGLSGLVLAELLRGRVSVSLYEATTKKCAFLTSAAERMQLDVTIYNLRTEDAPAQVFDVITARAIAPLSTLLRYAERFTGPNSVCLFLKGQNVGSELTEAHEILEDESQAAPKPDRSSGVILELTELVPDEPD